MATIKTEITALIGRCRRVGWDVEQAGNEWKVTFDDGTMTLIHSTYSDRNAAKRVLRTLEGKGLLEKEQEIEDRKEREKAERLVAERKAADTAAKKMARQASLTAKAAGPYAGPEKVPTSWFLEKHPAPVMRWVTIDPAQATAIMKRNTDNRPILPRTVAYYRDRIMAGGWHLTHQGMAMDTRGVLQDGQHRLQACIDADREISVPYFCGMATENFKAIDEGKNRSIADLLGKEAVMDRTLVGVTVRLTAAYREPLPRQFMRVKISNEQLYDSFKGDSARLVEATAFARRNYQKAGLVPSALGAAAYLLWDANGHDNTYVEAFLNGLVHGTKGDSRILLDIDDPRLILRNELAARRRTGSRLRAIEQMGYVLLAWNLIVDRSQVGRRIKWQSDRDDIPQIVVCRDRGRGASVPPDMLHGELTR
jgi:hypothetical protein